MTNDTKLVTPFILPQGSFEMFDTIADANVGLDFKTPGHIVYIISEDKFYYWKNDLDQWTPLFSGSGTGEINTASNVGTGDGWFKAKVGVDLQFKTVLVTDSVVLTVTANELSFGVPTLAPHIADMANPHNVTATQVGKDTAQWNADKIQGITVDDSAIGDKKILKYNIVSGKLEYVSDDDTQTAAQVTYNNLISNIPANNVQDAIDEIDGRLDIAELRLAAPNIVYVKTANIGPGEFTSIKDAVDSITTATFASQWIVDVGPGTFIEDTITLNPYIHIRGADRSATTIQVNDPSKTAVIGARTSSISDCTIQGATNTGSAAIYFSNGSQIAGQTYAFLVERISFGANNILIHNVGTVTAPSSLVALDIIKGSNTGNYIQGFKVENVVGGFTTTITLKNSQIIASTATTECLWISGTLGQIIMDGTSVSRLGTIAQTAVRVRDGGSIRIYGGDIRLHAKGIWLENVGAAPKVNTVGINLTLNTQDIVVDHPGASGFIDGIFDRTISFIEPNSTVVLNGLDRKIIRVAKLDTDYNSIKAAVDSITDSSDTNPYLITVGPGIYVEDPIVLNPFIKISGSGNFQTIVVASTPGGTMFTGSSFCELEHMLITGATDPSGIAIYYEGSATFSTFFIRDVVFGDNTKQIVLHSVNPVSVVIADNCSAGAQYTFDEAIIVDSTVGNIAEMVITNFKFQQFSPPFVNNFLRITGLGNVAILTSCQLATGGATGAGIVLDDGGAVQLYNSLISGFTNGIRTLNNGVSPSIKANSIVIESSLNKDILIEHPATTGSFQGTANMSLVDITLSPDFNIVIQDTASGALNVSRKVNIRYDNGTVTDISTLIGESSTSGAMEGGELSNGGGFTVNVADGFGYFEQFPDLDIEDRHDWPSTSILLTANVDEYIYFNNNKILVSSSSRPDPRYNIILGRVVTNGTGIELIDASISDAEHTSNLLSNAWKNALGPIYASGSSIQQNVTPFHLDAGSGMYYYGENLFSPSGGTNINFTQLYRNGSGGFTKTITNVVDHTHYDDGSGTLASITAGYYVKHSLYVVGEGANEKYYLIIAQNQYSTLLSAQQADIPSKPSYLRDSVALIAGIIILQGSANIAQVRDLRPVVGFKSEGVNASADHLSLLNLNGGPFGDGGHTNLMTVSGSKTMTGNLDLGGNSILNVVNINGIPVTDFFKRNGNAFGTDTIFGLTDAFNLKIRTSNIDRIVVGSAGVITISNLAGAGTKIIAVNNSGDLINTVTTTNLTEGTNLYYTNTRVDTRIATYTGDVTLTGTIFSIGAGKVTNAMLLNSSITLGTTTIALGATSTTLSGATLDNTNTVSFKDTLFTLQDDGDTTKRLQFMLAGITTATTRTLTIPNVNGTLPVGTGVAGRFTKWTGTNTITSSALISDDGAGTLSIGDDNVGINGINSLQLTSTAGNIFMQAFTSVTIETDTFYIQQNSGSFFTAQIATNLLSSNNVYTLPDVNGTFITTGNLTSITTVGTITSGVWNGTKVSEAFGGTNQSTYATGDTLYASAANTLSKLTIGSTGQVLTVVGGIPQWAAITAGEITLTTNHILIGVAGIATDVAMSGDATIVASGALTLATVNSNVGTFGSATQVAQVTVNAKGLVTAVSSITVTPAANSITGAQALTKTNDTNVTLTLGGTPATALLQSVSLTLGWTGLLSVARGGTGVSTFGGTNTLLYTTSADTLASITTANNGILITSGAGVPSVSSTLPTAVQSNITSTGIVTTGTWSSIIIVKDNVFTIQDNSDTTKQLQFELSGLTTATTRTLTIPDADGVLVIRDGIQKATLTTTNNTATTILTIATTSNTGYLLEVRAVSRRVSGTGAGTNGDTNSYVRTVSIKNVGGTITINTVQSSYTDEDIAAHNVTITSSGTNILVQVAGSTNNTVNWKAITDLITV